MTWYEKIISVHTAVTDNVSHVKRLKSDRYFVWQEESDNVFSADNNHIENTHRGSTDLYTKLEFDPWRDDFETALKAAGMAWYLNSVQFEEDTGFYHYEWIWEVP